MAGPRLASERTYHLTVAVIVLIGMAARLVGLGEGLWYDEVRTLVEYARRPLAVVITTYDSQNQHLLYSILARISFLVFGESAAALRLPAALLGGASLWACYRFARLVVEPRQAILATALLAASYHHVWFSQDARGYTGLLLFTLVGTGALLTLLEGRSGGVRAALWLYPLAMGLAVFTHVTAVLVSVAHAVVVGSQWWRVGSIREPTVRRPVLALAASAGVGLVLYAPVLPQLIATLTGPTPDDADTSWGNPLWLVAEAARGLARGLPGGWLAIGAAGLVALAGLRGFYRQSPRLVALMVLPAILTAVTILATGHNLWPRFFFFSMAFVVMIVIRGVFGLLEMIHPRNGGRVATAILTIAVLGSATTIPRAWKPKQDFGGAADFVETARGPGDAIATVDLTADPYLAYLPKPWPEVHDLAELEELERRHDRTWILYTFPIRLAVVEPEIWTRLQTHYDTARVFRGTVGGGDVVVMVSRPDPNANRRSP